MLARLALAALLIFAPAPPVVDLRAVEEGDHVVLTWTQHSDADQVCVYVADEYGIYIYADCQPSAAGPHREELPTGAMYNVVEWEGLTIYGDYWTPLTQAFRVYLPVASDADYAPAPAIPRAAGL